MINHAVLKDSELFFIRPEERKIAKIELGNIPNALQLHKICQHEKIAHVWIYPQSGIDCLGYSFFDNCQPLEVWYRKKKDGTPAAKQPEYVSLRVKGIYGETLVGYPLNGRWGWKINIPLDILATIDYLRQETGIEVEWSPGHMAFELVKKVHANDKHQEWTRESELDLRQLPFNKAARDVVFYQPLADSDVGKWIIHVDKYSAYMAACQGVMNGCGTPSHLTDASIIDIKKPGIYRVNVRSIGKWPRSLPPIINTEWITTNILQFALSKGYDLDVLEAWQFPEQHALFRRWAHDLWIGRDTLRNPHEKYIYTPGRENAYSSFKEIALIGVGKFAERKFDHIFQRPNWWAEIVSKARESMLRNLEKFASSGHIPFFVYCDGLYFVSPFRDPKLAIPGILDRDGELGGYKHVFSVRITKEMVEQSYSLKGGALIDYLAEKAEDK